MSDRPRQAVRTVVTGLILPAIAIAIAVAACGSSPSTGSTASLRPASASPRAVSISEADRDRTVVLRVGQRLVLTLHSTYWSLDRPTRPRVLRHLSTRTVGQPMLSTTCVVGQGCGTVTARYVAVRPGRAVVQAHRTTCGEALLCTGTAGSFEVTVRVR